MAGTPVALLLAGFLATRVASAAAERTYPPLGRLVDVAGVRQHVLAVGTGPPVVFVHGAYGGMQDFAATVLDEARERYHCVLWDRPGHGYSERPGGDVDPGVQARLLVALVRELGLERPVLVGFSYGGAVCLSAALEAPDTVAGVVLVNGPSHPWPDPLDVEYELSRVPLLGWLLSETLTAPLGHLLGDGPVQAVFDPLPVPASFSRSPLPLALRPASYRANTEDIYLLKPYLRAQAGRYAELRVPVRALVSDGDTVVRPTLHLPQLAQAAPDCSFVNVPGAGHQLLYTHPDLVLETLDALVREGPGSRDP